MKKYLRTTAISLLIVFATFMWTQQAHMLNYNTVLNNSCHQLWVNGPSTVETGENFEFYVQAWDVWERLSSTYTGAVTFELLSFNLTTFIEFGASCNLPSSYRFTGALIEQGLFPGYKLATINDKDCGRKTFNATILDEGFHYINVTDDQGHSKLSNPILAMSSLDLQVFWGDIHGHSALCDGSGYLEDVWRFAQEVAYLDFASVTTHDDWTDYYGTAPDFGALWGLSKAAANRWNQPHDFVALLSYEWTSQLKGYGHLNVYYKGADGPMFSSSYPQYDSQDELWDALRDWKSQTGCDVLTIPHHSAHKGIGMSYDWSYYDPEFVPLVEIYSAHGNSEQKDGLKAIKPYEAEIPGYHVQDALSMGYQVGIMASSDTHDGRLGHPILHTDANNRFQYPYTMMGLIGGFRFGEVYEGGLVGVYSENLTRSSVFNALKSRACYASTHVSRPILNFTINGVAVGVNDSTVFVDSLTSSRYIDFLVAADGGNSIQNITLIKNNVVLNYTTPNTLVSRFNYNDTDLMIGMNYTHGIEANGNYKINEDAHKSLPEFSITKPPSTNWNGTNYSDITDVYYMRVLQSNGDLAWIGPIWVKLK